MPSTGPTIFSSLPFTDEMWDYLKSVAPDAAIKQVVSNDPEAVAANVDDAEIACIHPTQDFDPALAPRLRWVLTASAGVDALVGKRLWRSHVKIVNASGIHAHSIAELVFAMILALRHRLPFFLRRQQEHVWSQAEPQARSAGELVGLTLGVLGYGSIGREVGRIGKAFGMRLLATTIDKSQRQDSGFALHTAGDREGTLPDVLEGPGFQKQLLSQSDVVVVAVPSSPKTRHLVGEDDLRAMKRTAILVNIARGAVVDEVALIRALQEGWIAAAGLDVFETEPLPADSPLWDMDNVIITPHIAGDSPDYYKRLMMLLAENIRREQAGEPLLNVVDKELAF
ncbi:MAG: D-2-hydroxyacid dehydrogenase [Anaerolineae bacterium]